MLTNLLLGFFFIALGAFSSGSFAVPYGKIDGWKWEAQWLIYSVGAYLLFPLITCLIFAPNFMDIYKLTSHSTLISVFLLGAVYGIIASSFILTSLKRNIT
jgi:L-rhamnose-H+ transport protein